MELFREFLSMDSTSGREREAGEWLASHLEAEKVQTFEVGDGTLNVLFTWGEPQVVFCSHMDTVPPYIAPVFEKDRVLGRGSCDAKGQVYAMYKACRELESKGRTGFGLLVLSGEETGSWGAKAFAKTAFKAPYLIVGEPTDNCMVSASKGTKSFDVKFIGKAFHSGYPENGRSAVEMFVDFVDDLRKAGFPEDPVLGATTYNIGLLKSDNPQNILSPELSCRIYFRTTFASDSRVCEWMESHSGDGVEVVSRGGDTPSRYFTLPGFDTKPVAFGSDAPHLTNFEHKAICGAGSIKVAHRDDEQLALDELDKATELYVRMFEQIIAG